MECSPRRHPPFVFSLEPCQFQDVNLLVTTLKSQMILLWKGNVSVRTDKPEEDGSHGPTNATNISVEYTRMVAHLFWHCSRPVTAFHRPRPRHQLLACCTGPASAYWQPVPLMWLCVWFNNATTIFDAPVVIIIIVFGSVSCWMWCVTECSAGSTQLIVPRRDRAAAL